MLFVSCSVPFVRTLPWGTMVLLFALLVGGCGSGSESTPALMNPLTRNFLAAGQEALRYHEFEAALALADSAEKYMENAPGAHFLRGRVFSEMLRFDDAEAAYRQVLDVDQDYRGVWHNLGNNAFRQQAYRQAIAYYERELAQHPASASWRGIGRAYQELGVVDSAMQAFERAVESDSAYVQPYIDLAQLYDHEGQFEEGLQQARRALALNPESQDAVYLAGLMLFKTGRFEEAVPLLEQVAEKWPWHHGAHYNLGQTLVRMGRREEGQAYMKRAEELRSLDARIENMQVTVHARPEDPYAHAGLGAALRRAGRYNDAMHAYKVALQLDPENLEFRNNVAVLHLLREDYEQAIAWFRNIVAQKPDFVDVWLNLGIVYAKTGQEGEARRAWQTVLQHEPDHRAARAYLARLDGNS